MVRTTGPATVLALMAMLGACDTGAATPPGPAPAPAPTPTPTPTPAPTPTPTPTPAGPATDEALALPTDYALAWSDEFDVAGLPDPAKWKYDTHRNKDGWYNNELQYYSAARPENSRVEGGRLIIEARAERLTGAADYGGQDYTSARLLSDGLADWQYGFFEIRAKLACGRGTWPAIWMLGSDATGGWPAQGEIDIMEHVGQTPGTVHGSIHTQAYNHVAGTQKTAQTMVPDACTAFHSYQLHWNADRILIGVDGRAFMRFNNDKAGNRETWPFSSPQYLILNVAVGGWGGDGGIDPAAFPAKMEIDYVRVWQKP